MIWRVGEAELWPMHILNRASSEEMRTGSDPSHKERWDRGPRNRRRKAENAPTVQ